METSVLSVHYLYLTPSRLESSTRHFPLIFQYLEDKGLHGELWGEKCSLSLSSLLIPSPPYLPLYSFFLHLSLLSLDTFSLSLSLSLPFISVDSLPFLTSLYFSLFFPLLLSLSHIQPFSTHLPQLP